MAELSLEAGVLDSTRISTFWLKDVAGDAETLQMVAASQPRGGA